MSKMFQKYIVLPAIVLAIPSVAQANFSIVSLPQLAQDSAPNWLFQIVSAILLLFAQVFGGILGLGTAAG